MTSAPALRDLPPNAPATEEQRRLLARAVNIGGRRKAPDRNLLARHPLRDDPTALRVYLADYGWRRSDWYALVVATPETTLADLALAAAAGMCGEPFHLWEILIPHPDARLRNRGSEFLARRTGSEPPPHNTKGHACPNCMYFGETGGSSMPDDPSLGPADIEAAAAVRNTTVAESATDLFRRDDWAKVVERYSYSEVVWETTHRYPHPVSQDARVLGFPAELPFAWRYDLGSGAPGVLRAVDLFSQSHLAALSEGQPHGVTLAFSVVDGIVTVNPGEE